jgi:hypothetical protein
MNKLVFFISILFLMLKSYGQVKLAWGKYDLKEIKKEPIRLIVYAELNVDTINMSDSTSFFENDICLKIQIDTIDLSNILFEVYKVNCFKNAYKFRYKNANFYLNELFSIKDYECLKKYKIKSFWISTNLNMDLFGIESNNNCLSERQKLFMYNIYTHYVKNTNKVFSYLYLENIKIGQDNIEENYINVRFSFPNFKIDGEKYQLIVK